MAITVYGTLADFFAGAPATILGARNTGDVQTALVNFSGMMDDYFRGRFPLPFARVGQSVAMRCAWGARYIFLGGRGFSPVNDADKLIVADYEETMIWLDKVQRRVLFPDVTVDPTAVAPTSLDPSPAVAQPIAISSSVVDMNGRRCATRGW